MRHPLSPFALRVVALLPRNLLSHLRLVLGETHSLATAATVAELFSLLRGEDANLLIVDPAMRSEQPAEALEEVIARHPSLPVIVYTTLSPAAMRQVVRLARVGVQHVVLNRFDDEPRRFLELIERVPVYPLAEMMLHELEETLRPLPVVLGRAIEQLIRSPSLARTSSDLARLAGMTPRTLYRYLTPAGLHARHLIICARLLRAYTFLRGTRSLVKEVAIKLGYQDRDVLSDQLRQWTGLTPTDLRSTVTPGAFVSLLAEHLRGLRAGAIGSTVEL